MSLTHRSYRHIVNSSVGAHLRKFQEKRACVEEKIDGSNFCFLTDGKEVKVARRNDLLTDNENFYQFQQLQHNGVQGIEAAKNACLKLYPKLMPHLDIETPLHVYIYGELVPSVKRIEYVRSGKVYFVVFDVLVIDPSKSESTLLTRGMWDDVLKEHGFLVNPILFEGTIEECLVFDVETTKSIVPKLLGEGDWDACIEGVVIKTDHFVVKKKAKAFRESGNGRTQKTNDPVADAVYELLSSMLVESRLDNIISQIGTNMVPDAPRLANTVVLDAIAEAKDDEESPIFKLSSSKLNKIKKELAGLYMDSVKTKMGW